MKPVDVKENTYIDSSKETNDKNPKFKIGDNTRISKYKKSFAKFYSRNWSEEVFVVKKKLKIVYRGHLLLAILTGNNFLERFTKTNCKKQIKNTLELKR